MTPVEIAKTFESPYILLQEAWKASKGLEANSASFKANPGRFVSYIDEGSGKQIHKIVMNDVPAEFRYASYRIISDARHALDQALHASIACITGSAPKKAYFPFADAPKDFDMRQCHADAPPLLKAFLRSLEPWPTGEKHGGGDDLLRSLGKISGPAKHKVIFRASFNSNQFLVHHLAMDGPQESFIPPKRLENKNEFLFIVADPGTEISYHATIAGFISIDEVGEFRSVEATGLINALLQKANQVVDGIKGETVRLLAAGGAI